MTGLKFVDSAARMIGLIKPIYRIAGPKRPAAGVRKRAKVGAQGHGMDCSILFNRGEIVTSIRRAVC
jgi:hypothetical protein